MKASLRGRVTTDGRLSLAGSSNLVDRNGKVWVINVEKWDTTLGDGIEMRGRWAQRVTRPPSSEYQEVEIYWMTKWPWPDGADAPRGGCP
jgi:hypothetical protein